MTPEVWQKVNALMIGALERPASARQAYREFAARGDTKRFGELASIGIGYVSGGNDFFHLRPSQAAELGIPAAFLRPTVRNGRLF